MGHQWMAGNTKERCADGRCLPKEPTDANVAIAAAASKLTDTAAAALELLRLAIAPAMAAIIIIATEQ